MKHTELDKKALQDEYSSINALLWPYLHGRQYDGPVSRLTAEDIDRAAAEQRALEQVESADMTDTSVVAACADYALVQEDQRIRRDARIARQGHKRLMQGCLETLWRRQLKLKKELGIEDA